MKKIFLQTAIMAGIGFGLAFVYLFLIGQVFMVEPNILINFLVGIICGAVGIVVSELVMNK